METVQYAAVSDIDFTTPAMKRRPMVNEEMDHGSISALRSSSHQTPKPSDAELMDLYHELSKAGKPVLLSLVPGFCNDYIPRCEEGILSLPLTDVFREDMLEAGYTDLLKICDDVFDKLWTSPKVGRSN